MSSSIIGSTTYQILFSSIEYFFSDFEGIELFLCLKRGFLSSRKLCRQVALLPTISKSIEKLVYNIIINFASQNNIFTNSLHGCRKGKSTETIIISYLSTLIYENIDKNMKCTGVLVDLSKELL